jgi:hypothetical protein
LKNNYFLFFQIFEKFFKNTNSIIKISIKELHVPETKRELTIFLATKVLQHFSDSSTLKKVYVTAENSTETPRTSLCSIITKKKRTHASNLKKNTKLYVESPDTDVALLLIHHYCQIPKETFFCYGYQTAQANHFCGSFIRQLRQRKTSALLGMHAITGSDTTCKLAGRTKEFSFKVFLN